MGQNAGLEHSFIHLNHVETFFQSKRLTEAVLSISENLRVKGLGKPYERIWVKLENQNLWSQHD